ARIDALDYAELRGLAPQIPLLETTVQRYQPHLHLFIEIKSPFDEFEQLQQIMSGSTPVRDYHLLSLDAPLFESVRQIPHEALLLVAGHNNVQTFCHQALSSQYGGVLGHYFLYGRTLREQLLSAGKKIGVGYVESRNSLFRELNHDIEWLFTNSVERIMAQ